MNLPPPSIDMCDGAAATWLDQLADLYTGTDATHVRGLAARLRRQHDEAIKSEAAALKSEAAALAKKIKDLESQLDDVDDQRRHLDTYERDAEAELAGLRQS